MVTILHVDHPKPDKVLLFALKQDIRRCLADENIRYQSVVDLFFEDGVKSKTLYSGKIFIKVWSWYWWLFHTVWPQLWCRAGNKHKRQFYYDGKADGSYKSVTNSTGTEIKWNNTEPCATKPHFLIACLTSSGEEFCQPENSGSISTEPAAEMDWRVCVALSLDDWFNPN